MASALMRLVRSGGNSLSNNQAEQIRALQAKLGIPTPSTGKAFRKIVLAIDATGSMGSVWNAAKSALAMLQNRLRELAPNAEIIIVAYRDHPNGERRLEVMPPSADTTTLAEHLSNIACDGGNSCDFPVAAVESVLEYLTREKPDLAIIAGDAPPHGVADAVVGDLDYRTFAQTLGKSGVPVYTLTTNKHDALVRSFDEIAQLTGGKMFHLDDLSLCADALSAAVAAASKNISLLVAMMQRENGGELSKRQETLLLTFSP